MAVSNDNKPWCSTKRQGFCCMCFGHLEWLIFTYFNGDCIINSRYSNEEIVFWTSKRVNVGAVAADNKCCDRVRCNGTGVQ